MPHIQIDYSANLETRLDVAGLCRVLRDAAVSTGVLPLAGIRVRAIKADHVVIADGNPDHAYLDISVRLRGGRTTCLLFSSRDFGNRSFSSESIRKQTRKTTAQTISIRREP